MSLYDHKKIEKKWRKFWEKNKTYKTPDLKKESPNEYILVEFPYPSGNLHIGHWYALALPDMYARKKRMGGKNVLYPIGFDAFGLPAENAAIKNNIDPKRWTEGNIKTMRKQLLATGASFDWSREIITCDPNYYKWTQWLFLQFFERGLAYRKKSLVNWDPVDKTVLANEQVLSDGTAERSGAKIEKRELEQWFLKITDYAERLLVDLDTLDWPNHIKEAQRNWIGKSEGTLFKFKIKNSDEIISIFTTRADTLFGVTYVVLAPEHELVKKLKEKIKNWKDVEKYIEASAAKSEMDRTAVEKNKTGVELKGITAMNPANDEEVPVWVADYVLGNYGTGAVMAVPAHDERDFEFAKKYELPIKKVVGPLSKRDNTSDEFFLQDGILINSGNFSGLSSEKARHEITKEFGAAKTTYRLRDWSIGRQRYWGCPVPIVYDQQGKPHPIPEKHLPWLLPTDVDHTPSGEPPLARSKELLKRTEKIFGKGWKPDVETMDTFVDSSWYYIRYLDPKNSKEIADKKKIDDWMPINYYFGGAEHTNLHLLYSRFFYKVMNDIGIVSNSEPYKKRLNRGLILGPDGNKMSKSKGNVVDPDDLVERLGADTVRMYLAFIGPYNEAGSYPWDPNSIAGIRRFLERVWKMIDKVRANGTLDSTINKTIKKVSDDIDALKLNTAISAMMIFVNEASSAETISKNLYETFLRLLAPFAPHITEELWEKLGHVSSIHLEKWPTVAADFTASESITIVVQIDGKTRETFSTTAGISEEKAQKIALALPRIKELADNKHIERVVFVKDRLINIIFTKDPI